MHNACRAHSDVFTLMWNGNGQLTLEKMNFRHLLSNCMCLVGSCMEIICHPFWWCQGPGNGFVTAFATFFLHVTDIFYIWRPKFSMHVHLQAPRFWYIVLNIKTHLPQKESHQNTQKCKSWFFVSWPLPFHIKVFGWFYSRCPPPPSPTWALPVPLISHKRNTLRQQSNPSHRVN